jgi:hypothetical protein
MGSDKSYRDRTRHAVNTVDRVVGERASVTAARVGRLIPQGTRLSRGLAKRSAIGSIVALLLLGSVAMACNIPVFRYALERWRPDACEVIVFHEGELKPDELSALAKLEGSGAGKQDGTGAGAEEERPNVKLIRSRIGDDPDARNRAIWESMKGSDGVRLPYVVVRTVVSDKRAVNSWHGPLDQFEPSRLLDSPIRRELSRRLLGGHAVVWLLIKSPDASKTAKAKGLLTEELKKLSRTVEFPEGLGLPGSELYAEVPLLMEFSLLEVDPNDPAESFLMGLFRGFHPEASEQGQPLLVPVFGRGRALEVIPGDRLDGELIGDLTRYLCGACSCQVKEQNPGFDLLVSTAWDRELFGEEGETPPPAKEFDPDTAPTLLTIPPGKKVQGPSRP